MAGYQKKRINNIFRFIVKDRDTFFTSAQRTLIVWQILMRTRYGDSKDDHSKVFWLLAMCIFPGLNVHDISTKKWLFRQVGIVRLLSKGTYSAAYPLHDGRYDKDGPNGEQCARRVSRTSLINNNEHLIKNTKLQFCKKLHDSLLSFVIESFS